MAKKIKYSLLCFFLLLIVFGILKNQFLDTPVRAAKRLPSSGEIFGSDKLLAYKLYYCSVFPIGEMRLSKEMDAASSVVSLEATPQGSWLAWFINASIKVRSYTSTGDALTTKYVETKTMKGKVKEKVVLFDQEKRIATRTDKNVKIRLPKGAFDGVGAFMHVLSLPYAAGGSQEARFFSEREIYVLKVTQLGTRGNIDEFLIEIFREDMTSTHGAKFHLWVTADERRVPLVFKSWTPIGYASVVFSEMKNNSR